MSTSEVATTGAKAVQPVSPAQDVYLRLKAVQNAIAPDLSADELKLFALVSARSGLDPFAKQIFAIKRKGRVTFQTGIDGYRSIAARTGEYEGQDEPVYGPVCACAEVPPGHPEFATVRVYRTGMGKGLAATAYWHEYKPAAGESGRGDEMWRKMPRVMIAKVAEALALRKAFPWVMADVYTREEMAQADNGIAATPAPTAGERIAARRAQAEAAQPATADASEGEYRDLDDGRQVDTATGEIAPEAAPDPTPAVCGAPSPLTEGATCDLAAGHEGVHRIGDSETFPRVSA